MTETTITPPKWPKNTRIREVAYRSALNVVDLIQNNETKILELIDDTEEGPVSINHSIKVDQGKGVQTNKISFAQKTSDEISDTLSDPNQPTLPGTEGGAA